jgi:hypothetical protein
MPHPWDKAISFAVMDIDLTKRPAESVGAPLTMVPHEEGTIFGEPTFSLNTEAAQKLMDSLWAVGIRPSEGTSSTGAMRATQKHLEDMRWLAMKGKGPK